MLRPISAPCLTALLLLAASTMAGAAGVDPNNPHQECSLNAREVVEQFTQMLFEQKQVRRAFETWVHPDYIQHKPSLADGREAVIEFLEALFARAPDRIFTIHRIIATEDLVAVHYHSQADPNDLGFAVVDIFRVEDCQLVEHWDVVQPVPDEAANDNTMF